MAVRYLLFDNDGVLVESEHLYYQANAEILAEQGFELTRPAFAHTSLGLGESVLRLCPGIDDARHAALTEQRDQRYDALLEAADNLAMPGVSDLLPRLAERYQMAVVTSCRPRHFSRIHRDTGLLGHMAFVLAKGDYARSKPHPDPYLTALERFSADASEAVVIEDSPRGLASARAAGIRCAVLRSALTAELNFDGAWRVIDGLAELPGVLAQV
ncbi:MAG: HAD family phosphatase [Planctomycetota bacterium]|jgi:HAD superfamily hydrolase (TIGR01509 family)|nr:HAD family phosphatase [Planctomycetota bacterium]